MIVKNVDFSVINQTVKFSTMAQLVANSAGIATATFTFSSDWDSYDVIKVIFQNGETAKAIILADGLRVVTIPAECIKTGHIAVSAVGLMGAEGEETFKRATVEKNNGVEVIASGAYEGSAADLPTPTEAEQILLIATDADTKATAAKTHADTYKGLRLAAQSIVPEGTTAATIVIDKYTDGTPLNSVLGGKLLFYSGANTSITTVAGHYIQINGITANSYVYGGGAINAFYGGNVAALYSLLKADIEIVSQNVTFAGVAMYRYSSSGNTVSVGGVMTSAQTAINSIKLFLSSGTFPAGTVVEWWERG